MASIFLAFLSIYKLITTVAPDFSVLWLTTRDLLVGKNPYLNPEIFTGLGYPPHTLIFYVPLALLPYEIAQVLFILFSFASIVAVVFLSLKISFEKIPWVYFLIAFPLSLLSFPTKFTLGMGQNNATAFLFLLISFFFYGKGGKKLSGVLLGLSAGLKPILGFFLLFFLVKKEWKILLSAISTLLVLAIITIFLPDINLYGFYFQKVVPPLLNPRGSEIYYNQGLLGFISRLNENLSLRRSLWELTSIALVSLTLLLTSKRGDKKLQFSLFVLALPLIDKLSWQHHFVWLILPFVVLASYAVKIRKLWFWGLLIAAYLLASWNFKNPELFQEFPKSLLLSNTFYGTVILLGLNTYLLLKTKPTSLSQ
ncbi:MAG: glycosyltransferase family 87 protein [Patescibacteria group bacterium]